MKRTSKSILLVTVAAFALASCTEANNPLGPKSTDGAVIGGLIGAVIGARKGGDLGDAAVGAAVGAGIGAVIGDLLDKQEEALRGSMDNDEVKIVNTGSELIVTLPQDITFDVNSDAVRYELRDDLRALASNLNDFPDSTVDVIGHTDNTGAASFNQELSARRAGSVAGILTSSGVSSSRIRAFGRGEDEPIATNLTDEGRAQNRRVEIVIRPNA